PGLPAAEMASAASLFRVMLLLVPLVSAAEVLRAYLNACHSFGAPAAMNVIMNGLAAALVFAASGHRIFMVAWAYAIGATAQLLFMLVSAYRRRFRFHPCILWQEPELRAVGRLCVRPLTGAGLNPLARVGEQLFVSFLPPGSITILNYAYRLISAIGGTVLFRSVMVVMLPPLTEASTRGDQRGVLGTLRAGVRIMLLLSVPLTLFGVLLAQPAALVVFHRGNFSRDSAVLLGLTLSVYCASLIGAGLQRSLLAPFYATKDMRTPLRNSMYGVVANMALLPALVLPFAHNQRAALFGVAIAFSISQYVNVAHAWYQARRRFGDPFESMSRSLIRLAVGSAEAAVLIIGSSRILGLGRQLPRLTLLAHACAVGLLGLAGLLLVLVLLPDTPGRPVLRPLAADRPKHLLTARKSVI
ncbi:MAG: murein biosynthesis integral membrane protein MurJ, partial [Pseudonocardiaceae bacterium]